LKRSGSAIRQREHHRWVDERHRRASFDHGIDTLGVVAGKQRERAVVGGYAGDV